MKVLISFSGERSRHVADILCKYLPLIVNAIEPWFSSKNLEKGGKWPSSIFEQLKETNVGIVCLTRENMKEPWILFESGAISKQEESRLCTFLVDIEKPTDVPPPLGLFQHTAANQEDFFALRRSSMTL